jgi:uncharacterized protein (DUF488 family)
VIARLARTEDRGPGSSEPVTIYTIGFTKKSAADFFGILQSNDIRRVVDIRLNNSGQLAGFTKSDDLRYFLAVICGAEYVHEPSLSPTKELLTSRRDGRVSWAEYEQVFGQLMVERGVADTIDRSLFATPAVLLCSEATADHCHRRLVAEYLKAAWGDVEIVHL